MVKGKRMRNFSKNQIGVGKGYYQTLAICTTSIFTAKKELFEKIVFGNRSFVLTKLAARRYVF